MAMFIAKATANAHGQFRAKAQKAKMSTAAFARHVMANPDKHDEETRKQANLAMTLMRLGKRGRGKSPPATSTPSAPSAPMPQGMPPEMPLS